jgi:hypothetical protein
MAARPTRRAAKSRLVLAEATGRIRHEFFEFLRNPRIVEDGNSCGLDPSVTDDLAAFAGNPADESRICTQSTKFVEESEAALQARSVATSP